EWSSGRDERAHGASSPSNRPSQGDGAYGGGDVSSGKKFVAMSLLTFIVIVVLGVMWGHHAPADPTGPTFNSLGNYPSTTTNVPVTQVGINNLASDVGHLAVSINFTWTLL